MGRRVHWELCKKYGIECAGRWYEHVPNSVTTDKDNQVVINNRSTWRISLIIAVNLIQFSAIKVESLLAFLAFNSIADRDRSMCVHSFRIYRKSPSLLV